MATDVTVSTTMGSITNNFESESERSEAVSVRIHTIRYDGLTKK